MHHDRSGVLESAGDHGDFAFQTSGRASGVFDGENAAQSGVNPINALRHPVRRDALRRTDVRSASWGGGGDWWEEGVMVEEWVIEGGGNGRGVVTVG